MRRWAGLATSVLTILVGSISLAGAGTPLRDKVAADQKALDATLEATLGATDPEAAKLFAKANAWREANDLPQASKLYAELGARIPTFDAAFRRQCSVESALGNRSVALPLCRKALALAHSKENLAALAVALIQPASGATVDQIGNQDLAEAVRLASEASDLAPSDAFYRTTLCQVAASAQDKARLASCSERLLELAPDEATTWIFVAVAALDDGRVDDATKAIERARVLGAPTSVVEELLRSRDEVRRSRETLLSLAGKVAIWWAVGMAVLLGLGWVLSEVTLRAVRSNAILSHEPTAGERWIRRIYRVVITVASLYYYVSIPLVLAAGLAGVVLLFYAFLVIGILPVKLGLIIGFVALYTVYAVLRSVFVRAREVSPGEMINQADHPKLDAVLRAVAERVGTRPVDTVYLTPGTDIAVTERGGMWKRFFGKSERALILGVGVLEGMTIRQLESILAHEYGHFRNEDTAGGDLAMAVRRSLLVTTIRLAQGGAASVFNPAWLFVRGFERVFLRISQGASRLQEALADRGAVRFYGAPAFAAGLRHVIDRSVRFGAHADAVVDEVVRGDRPLGNLYRFEPTEAPDEADIDEKIEKAMNESSPYDSHPSPTMRLALIESIQTEGVAPPEGDDEEAWTLFEGRRALEKKLTALVRERLAARGHTVRAPKKKPKPPPEEDAPREDG